MLGFILRAMKYFDDIDICNNLSCTLVCFKVGIWIIYMNIIIISILSEEDTRKHFVFTGTYPIRGFPDENFLHMFAGGDVLSHPYTFCTNPLIV